MDLKVDDAFVANALSKLKDPQLKINIRRMLQLKNDDSCCFDAVINAHMGILPSSSSSEEEFLAALATFGFKQVEIVGGRRPEEGDIICLTYHSTEKNDSMFGPRTRDVVRYQHAFIYLDDTTIFQKSGCGPGHQFEITKFGKALFDYAPKVSGKLSNGGKEPQNVTVPKAMLLDERILCFRQFTTTPGCIVS